MQNWRTIVLGYLALGGAVVAFFVKVFSGEPFTLDEFLVLVGLTGAGGVGLAAKDSNK